MKQREENPRRRFPIARIGICLMFGVFLLACSDNAPVEEEDDAERNVLKEYINTPKEKAMGVKNKLESRTAEQNRQLGIE